MGKRLLALLIGVAAVSTPATAVAAPSGLHDCGTKIDRNVGNGWCKGTGSFRIVVACQDGTSVRSVWLRLYGGYGTLGVSCRSVVDSVTIEQR